MEEEVRFTGWWWLPEKPNEKLPGTLEITSDKKIVLTTTGIFKSAEAKLRDLNYHRPIDLINGYAKGHQTKKDKSFTLISNHIDGYWRSGLIEVKWATEYLVTNKHFKFKKEIRANSVFLKFQFLDEWVDQYGFEIESNPDPKIIETTIKYKQPEPITLLDGDKFKIYLFFRASAPLFSIRKVKASITQSVFFNIEFKRRQSLEVITELSEKLRNFFSLAISLPIKISEFEFKEFAKDTARKKGMKYQHTITVLPSESIITTGQKDYRTAEMLLTYKDFNDASGNIIGNWLKRYDVLEPVFKRYFDTLYNPYLHQENVFLNYVSALETYHRRTNPNFDAKTPTYDKKLKQILQKIDHKNEREWIRVRLEKKSEIYLMSRLKDLSNSNRKIVKDLVRNKNSFLSKIVATRHYHLHFDEEANKRNLISDSELPKYIQKLRILLQALFLKELGFSQDFIQKMIKKPMHNAIHFDSL